MRTVGVFLVAFLAASSAWQDPPAEQSESPVTQEKAAEPPQEPPAPPPPPDGILPIEVLARYEYAPSDRPRVLLHQDRLLVVSAGLLESFDAETGELQWKLGLAGIALFRPVLPPSAEAGPPGSGFEILLSAPTGRLVRVDAKSGEIRDERQLPFELALPPLMPRPTVLFGATPTGDVVSYDLDAGELRFRTQTGEPPLALAYSEGLVVASGAAQTLTAIDAERGVVRWTFRGRGPFHAPAVFRQGERLYIGDDAGEFYCLSAETGKIEFRWSTGAAIRSPALVEGDRVYVATFANTLYAYHAGNGHEQWRSNLPGRPAAGPLRVHQRLMVATLDGVLLELAGAGQHGKSYAAPGELAGPPALKIVPPPPVEAVPESEPAGTEAPSSEPAEPEPKKPLWYERSRVALALRTGEVLLLKHQVPEAPEPESPDGKPPASPAGVPPPLAR